MCCSGDEIKEDKMGGTCGTYGVEDKYMQVLLGNLKETDNLEDILVAGNIILKLI
jgi:hypothetical protein